MNELQLFSSNMFGAIRATIIDCNPWFVGSDVAKALEYADLKKAIYDHVDQEDKQIVNGANYTLANAPETPISNRDLTIINESGVYSLIFQSKQERAKEFKRWVTSEVLPALRKTGRYAMPNSRPVPKTNDYFKALHLIGTVRADRLPYLFDSFAEMGLKLPDPSGLIPRADNQVSGNPWERKNNGPKSFDRFRDTNDEVALVLRKAYNLNISLNHIAMKSEIRRSNIYKYMWGDCTLRDETARQRLIDAANALIALADSHAPAQ